MKFTIGGESHETKIDSWQRSNVSPSIELTVERTMTTEQKALALVREVLAERNLSDKRAVRREVSPYTEALCRAIEQHEAFRQEVSDAVEDTKLMVETHCDTEALALVSNRLNRFIIPKPKPDPLVAALEGVTFDHYPPNDAKIIHAALDALGFEIRKKNDD